MSVPPRRAALSAIVLALVLGPALAGCGGSAKVSDVVPKSTPELTPPEGHTAENSAAKKTHVTTLGSAAGTTGESGSHSEATENTSSSESSSGESSSESSGGGSASGAGGGTTAGEKSSESSSGKGGSGEASSGTGGGASAP